MLPMYLDSYVTALVRLWHGSCSAGGRRREPEDAAGDAGPRPGDRGGAGCVAADRSSGRLPPPPSVEGSGAGRGPPGGAAAGLQSSPRTARRSRSVAWPLPVSVGAAVGRPADRGGARKTRTKERDMTSNASPGTRILGSLRSADGAGVVRIEDRYDTDIDDLWSAITDPVRLARWHGQIEGELRPGGEFRLYLEADDIDSTGRIDACEP